MKPWLNERLFAENPDKPMFAFVSTLNWMRALSMLAQSESFESEATALLENAHCKRESSPHRQDTAFAKLFLAQSYLAALRSLKSTNNPYDIVRLAIVAWYYCTYFSSHAMLAIAGNNVPEQHAKTASLWLNRLVSAPSKPLVPYPLCLHVTSMVKKTVDRECEHLKRGCAQDLKTRPTTLDQANDAYVTYLKGTADFYRTKEEKKVRESKPFKEGGFRDFRKREARRIRDETLGKRPVGFLDMAFRYRGKANYRDAIFLSYGQRSPRMPEFLDDLNVVASAYYDFAQRWVERRTPSADWAHFLDDLGRRSLIATPTCRTGQAASLVAAIP